LLSTLAQAPARVNLALLLTSTTARTRGSARDAVSAWWAATTPISPSLQGSCAATSAVARWPPSHRPRSSRARALKST